MRKVFKNFSILLGSAVLGLGLVAAPAHALDITPATPGIIPGSSLTPATGPSNCEPGCVYQAFGLPNDGSLSLLYKADVGDAESPATTYDGTFSASYTTTFLNTALDPSGATIEHVAGADNISCPSCYLAIKDGNHSPTYYFFNLGGWNGVETINLSGFWPQRGAISHVAIWGTSTAGVPEPSSLLLLGAGLAGIGIWRMKFARG